MLIRKPTEESSGERAPAPADEQDEHPDEVDFDNFEELIAKVQEAKESIQRNREQVIVQETDLSPELFRAHKDELILMYEAFQSADHNGNGSLEWNEVAGILIDCGLLPRDQCEQRKIEDLLRVHDTDCNGAIDYGEFLGMMQDVRAAWRRRLEPELRDLFNKYDKDGGGSLSLSEVATMIGDMGLNPKSREDQDEMKLLLDNVDADGSGEFDFYEFQDLVQRIEEKLKSLQRRRDLSAGEELGFTPPQVCELRGVFFKLDVNGDENISSSEIQRLAQIMRKRIKQDHLMQVFREIDGEDGNGSLDFVEFMTIVRRLDLL
jgi:Ca2+-binding EF-hand superfamily protein